MKKKILEAAQEETCRGCSEVEDALLHHGEEWDGIQAHSFKPGGWKHCPKKVGELRCDLALNHEGDHCAWPLGGAVVC
jgi:hypothetical protein